MEEMKKRSRCMRRVTAGISIAVIIWILAGCGYEITSGEVIAKEFTPSHTDVRFIPVVRTNGKTTTTTMIPYFYHYPDKYTITIAGYGKDGELAKETYSVTEDVYNAVAIGSEFVYDPDMEPDQPEYRREPANKS